MNLAIRLNLHRLFGTFVLTKFLCLVAQKNKYVIYGI